MASADSEVGRELSIGAPSRDSLEFAAGLLLGVAAGIGLGTALSGPRVRRCLSPSGGREGGGRSVRRVVRRLRRG